MLMFILTLIWTFFSNLFVTFQGLPKFLIVLKVSLYKKSLRIPAVLVRQLTIKELIIDIHFPKCQLNL
jgi:hypothetical protein